MTISRARSEQGFALVTAMIVMGIMMTLGLAIYAYSDGQTTQTRLERVRESSFNLAERALEQQTFKLSRAWAGAPARAYPGPTIPAGAQSCSPLVVFELCPSNTELISAGDSPDADAETTWMTIVRDNGDTDPATDTTGEDFYTAALVDARPSWDANNDGIVWVKATATVRQKTRTLVAKVRVESVTLPFPKVSIIANTLFLSSEGNKKIIDTNGPLDGDTGPVLLRCPGSTATDCIDSPSPKPYDPDSDARISPPSIGRFDGDSVVDVETQDALEQTARANGTVYDSCPSEAQLTGDVVYITAAVGDCSYSMNGAINSADSPGIIVVESSGTTFELSGNVHFYGLMYFMNSTGGPAPDKLVLDLSGTIVIHGSVAIDGDGALKVGDSGAGGQDEPNVSFDQSLFGQLKTYGTAGILQNSWREIRG